MYIHLISALLAATYPSLMLATATSSIPTYAPVPPTGVGPSISPCAGYRVESFGGGAYMTTDGEYQSLFFVSNESVIAVDAPPTTGHNLMTAIRTVTNLPISHLVYSHAHADHIGSAYLLVGQDTVIISQEETVKGIASSINGNRPKPNITFAEDYELTVGNQTLHLSYKGINHDPGNIFIYAPAQKILMLVDVIYPGWIPYAHLGESQNIPGWINAHDQVLEYDFDHFVGGHINRAGTREDVLTQKEYITDLYNNCAEAILLGPLPPNATNPVSTSTLLPGIQAVNPNNLWAWGKYLDDARIEYCSNKTNEKWLGRLAGIDVYETSNAETMLESLKLDFGLLGSDAAPSA